LTKLPSTKDSYSRTRQDHSTETAEDYVEAIFDLIEAKGACRAVDLAEQFGVSHVTVSKIISRLDTDGLVEAPAYKPIGLTPEGKLMAARVRKRHELVYSFLIAIGVDAKTAAIDSEGIEHHVSTKTLARMRAFIEERSGDR